jgi:branched-chain amino acid transport system substrate-binding protein
MIALEAIKRAGSTDKAKVLSEIENTTNFIGVDGIFNMSATNHLGLDENSFVMVEVKDGSWQLSK